MVAFSSAQNSSEDVAHAVSPQATEAELSRYAVHRSAHVRAAVAARPDCPVGALIALGHDHDPEVLQALLRNPLTPTSVVRALADHRNPEISDLAVQRLRNSFR